MCPISPTVRACIVVLHFTHNTQTHFIYLHTPELHMRLCVASFFATTRPRHPTRRTCGNSIKHHSITMPPSHTHCHQCHIHTHGSSTCRFVRCWCSMVACVVCGGRSTGGESCVDVRGWHGDGPINDRLCVRRLDDTILTIQKKTQGKTCVCEMQF